MVLVSDLLITIVAFVYTCTLFASNKVKKLMPSASVS